MKIDVYHCEEFELKPGMIVKTEYIPTSPVIIVYDETNNKIVVNYSREIDSLDW